MYDEELEQSKHISEYYYVLTKRKWFVVVPVVILVSLVLWHNAHLIPTYNAGTTLIIDKENARSPLTGQRMGGYETYLSESLTFNTHFKLITSYQVLGQVVQDLKLDEKSDHQDNKATKTVHPFKQYLSRIKENIHILLGRKKEAASSQDETTHLIQWLKAMVNIKQIEDTRLLNLNVSHHDPVMARDIANAVAQAYINFNINNRLKASQNTLKWLSDNLYEMKKNLEDAEAEFIDYKQNEKLFSVKKSQEMIAQKMREFNEAYIRARNRRLELDAKLKQLKKASQPDKKIPNLRSLIASSHIDILYSNLVKAELELSRASKVFKPKHPKIIQINTRIEDTRKKLNEEIEKELANLKAERALLLAKEKVLQSTISEFEKEALEIGKKELQHRILERNVEMNQKLYDTILSRLKETDVTGNIDVSNIRIVEKALLPTTPAGPNKKRNLGLGAVIGLMIGISLAFFLEYLDRSLHTEEDIEKHLGLPVLSVIPKADRAKSKGYGAEGRERA